ncbi:MAG: DUF262 domain-containing protein [Defluviitaleaceae bacterium]|nr:DUF262 domain-containing protein [Defluviitaleaceae bacterium]
MESSNQVVATEEKLTNQINNLRNRLKTDKMDMSFGEIMNMYERNEIIIDPEFQRLYRWNLEQKTRFMESLLLGVPIPPIFVAETTTDGRWELVDGLQRLSTVLSFFGILKSERQDIESLNNWTLSSGDLIEDELEGYNRNNLPLKYQLNLKRAVCRVEIIKWDSKWDMRYELFSRLNTGGTLLTDQEIRNAIFRKGLPKFYTFIDEAVKNVKYKELTSLSSKQLSEKYDHELVVRFASLVDNWGDVDKAISLYMTSFMRNLLDNKKDISNETIYKFNEVVDLLHASGKQVFRFPTGMSIFSSSLYEGIMIGIASNLEHYKANPASITERIDDLKNDDIFKKNSGTASNSKNRTKNRIKRALEVFGGDISE